MYEPQNRTERLESRSVASPAVQRRGRGGGEGLREQAARLSPAIRAGYDVQRRALAPVQRSAGADATAGVHEAAASGVSGAGGSLPYLRQIQTSFGRHAVGDVQAHVGGRAAAACDAMGAEAYASGGDVAFGAGPSLHTAAHEAAHVVQQRGGVQLSGGVGRAGDAHERHADQVADLVVQGKSAESLLDSYTGSGGGGVQLRGKKRGADAVSERSTTSDAPVRQVGHAKDVLTLASRTRGPGGGPFEALGTEEKGFSKSRAMLGGAVESCYGLMRSHPQFQPSDDPTVATNYERAKSQLGVYEGALAEVPIVQHNWNSWRSMQAEARSSWTRAMSLAGRVGLTIPHEVDPLQDGRVDVPEVEARAATLQGLVPAYDEVRMNPYIGDTLEDDAKSAVTAGSNVSDALRAAMGPLLRLTGRYSGAASDRAEAAAGIEQVNKVRALIDSVFAAASDVLGAHGKWANLESGAAAEGGAGKAAAGEVGGLLGPIAELVKFLTTSDELERLERELGAANDRDQVVDVVAKVNESVAKLGALNTSIREQASAMGRVRQSKVDSHERHATLANGIDDANKLPKDQEQAATYVHEMQAFQEARVLANASSDSASKVDEEASDLAESLRHNVRQAEPLHGALSAIARHAPRNVGHWFHKMAVYSGRRAGEIGAAGAHLGELESKYVDALRTKVSYRGKKT